MGFRIIGFPPSCHPNYGALTSTPAGLAPAEHTSLHWTHIDAQNFRHLLLELGIAAFQIVTHLMRFDFLLTENHTPWALSGGWGDVCYSAAVRGEADIWRRGCDRRF
jgi:hypothetical protein